MKTTESKYSYEKSELGEKIPALKITGEIKPLTVT